jgi:hypothetical protein
VSSKEVEELIEGCRALDWAVKPVAKGYYQILPAGGGNPILSPARTNGRSLANFKADLRRAGFNPEAVAAAKALKAEQAIAKDREKNTAALARAAERAKEAALAPAPAITTAAPPKAPTLINPFATPPVTAEPKPMSIGTESLASFQALVGYPRVAVKIGQKRAAEILAYAKEQQEKEDGCRQRKIYRSNAAKLQQAMELGDWYLNPADGLVFCREHKSIVNGQHRMKALADADTEFIEAYYENGEVEFEVTTDFPCHKSHIFDTGKSRSATDALTAERLVGWNPLAASALRLAMQYDLSFQKSDKKDWTKWRNIIQTNSQFVAGGSDEYLGLLDNSKVVSRAYTRSRVTRSAAMVAAFLFERDNPGGNPRLGLTNELFWKGVCDDDTITVGDPRRAVIRMAAKHGGGPLTLAYLLKGYGKYMAGKKVELLGSPDDLKAEPMLPVWTPSLRWEGKKLVPVKRPV